MKVYQVYVTYKKPSRGRFVHFKKHKIAERFKGILEKHDKDQTIKKIYINEIEVYDQLKIIKENEHETV